jgi:hypothetical protein
MRRRSVVMAVIATALAACIVALAWNAATATTPMPRRYVDYLGVQPTTAPCALPIKQRAGGWACPEQ